LSTEAQGYISRIENLIAQAEEKGKPTAAGMYEVVRGDYLWKIAKSPDIMAIPMPGSRSIPITVIRS